MAKHKISYTLPAAVMAMSAFAALPTTVMAGTSVEHLTSDLSLTESVAACYVVKAGSKVTIDFGSFDITCADGSAITVEKGATATIKGSGKVISKTGGAAVFNKGGNVTIESGTYLAENWYTIKNLGTMIFNDGVVGGTEHKNDSSLFVNGWYDGKSTTGHDNDGYVVHGEGEIATLTINGGNFTHLNTTSTIKSDDYSKTIINKGNFKSEQGKLIQATGDVTVNGGTFTGYNSLIGFNATGEKDFNPGTAKITNGEISAKSIVTDRTKTNEDGTGKFSKYASIEITGGTFKDLESIVASNSSSAEAFKGEGISGGTFNIEPEALIAKDYTAVYDKEAGTFGVVSPKTIEADNEEIEKETVVIDGKEKEVEVVYPKVVELKGETMESKAGDETVAASAEFVEAQEADRKATFVVAPESTKELKLEASSSNTNLAMAFDLSLRDRDNKAIEVKNTKVNVKIALTDEQQKSLKEYKAVYAVYFDEEGKETEDRIAAKLTADGSIEFTVTHFSTYGIVGVNETEADDKTDDETNDVAEDTVAAPDTGAATAAGASAISAGVLTAVAVALMAVIAKVAIIAKRK